MTHLKMRDELRGHLKDEDGSFLIIQPLIKIVHISFYQKQKDYLPKIIPFTLKMGLKKWSRIEMCLFNIKPPNSQTLFSR